MSMCLNASLCLHSISVERKRKRIKAQYKSCLYKSEVKYISEASMIAHL